MSENTGGKKKPTTFSELYPGRFLHADHLKGKPHTLTIADVDREELHGEKGKEMKTILAFRETPLLLVFPKLNGACARAMFGNNIQDWIGKRLTLYPTNKIMPMGGEECIRVYGSPDITRDMDIEIPMPRRKAIKITLRQTSKMPKGPAQAAPKADATPSAPVQRDEAEHDDEPPLGLAVGDEWGEGRM